MISWCLIPFILDFAPTVKDLMVLLIRINTDPRLHSTQAANKILSGAPPGVKRHGKKKKKENSWRQQVILTLEKHRESARKTLDNKETARPVQLLV